MLRKYVVFSFLLLALFFYIIPNGGFAGDVHAFTQWAIFIQAKGIGHVYECGADYLPLYYYLLSFFGKLLHSPDKIPEYAEYLKIITLVFHLITGYVLVLFIMENGLPEDTAIFRSLFYVLNLAVLYNAVIWAQTDDILACFAVLSFYAAWKKRITTSLCMLVFMLNFKLQGIVFVPLLGLLILPVIRERYSTRNLISWVAIPAAIQFILLWPFLNAGTLQMVWENVLLSADRFPVVSMNAFNFWLLPVPDNQQGILDSTTFLKVSYRTWGFLMFLVSSLAALFPLLRQTSGIVFYKKREVPELDQLLIVAALLPLCFYFFNTQMHERYTHPALVFLWAYSLRTRHYLPAILCSIAYFLNLERVLQFLPFQNYGVAVFSGYLICSLYGITMGILYHRLYQWPRDSWKSYRTA